MNFILTPSLEDRALVEIAITLWSQEDVRDSTLKSLPIYLDGNWTERQNLLNQVTKLPLPNILKLKLSKCVEAVGENMRSWIMSHIKYISITKLPAFFWTPHGTIDEKRAAEALVKDESLEVRQRFQLACNYCLEDDIRYLWKTFDLREIRNENAFGRYLESFWSYYVDAEYDQFATTVNAHNLTAYQYGFRESAKFGNKVATEYFWKKLNSKEEADFIMETAREVAMKMSYFRPFPYGEYSEVFLFLLSTLNDTQQTDISSSYPYEVLKALLVWPWRTQFLEVVQSKLTLLSRREHRYLLDDIVNSNNYDPELFRELWQLTPKKYKKYYPDRKFFKSLFYCITKNKDEKNLQMILKDLSAQSRKEIAFNPEIHSFMFEVVVEFELWDSVKFFIEEYIPSPKEIEMFENSYRKYAAETYSKQKVQCECEAKDYKRRWDIFFQIVEECKKEAYRSQ